MNERTTHSVEHLIASAVWLHYYGSPEDPESSAVRISRAVAMLSEIPQQEVVPIVDSAMYSAEGFDSLIRQADETTADILLQAVPVYLWTVGIPDIQRGKAHAIRRKVRHTIADRIGNPDMAGNIVAAGLHTSISTYSKMSEFEAILERLREQGKQQVYVADDNWDNLEKANDISVGLGVELANFRINRDHPAGSFPACRAHLNRWLGSDTRGKAVVFDVDDTVFNETGPNGRISKIAKIIARNLAPSQQR